MTRTPVVLVSIIVASVIALLVTIGFTREEVMRAGDLLELKAVPSASGIVVTGTLLASGLKISRTTTSQYGSVILVRVYAAMIEDRDNLGDLRGTFVAVIPRTPGMRAIMVGDGSRTLTIGRLYGMPIRIPRLKRDHPVNRVVWTAQ